MGDNCMLRIMAYCLVALGASLIFVEQHAPLAGLGLLISAAGFMLLGGQAR